MREAQDALLRRYLQSYGPATLQDFTSWSGLAVGDAPIWGRLAEAGETVEVTIDGISSRVLRGDLSVIQAALLPTPHVRLFAAFDVYLLAHRDKRPLVSAAHQGRITARPRASRPSSSSMAAPQEYGPASPHATH